MARTTFTGPVRSLNGFEGSFSGVFTGITALTDSSGGTADDTIDAIPAATAADTDTSAASLASTNAAITALQNAVADLAAKVNEMLAV